MALYRTGTASMDAQGVITGVGTKWREPLSLIRTGATIVFLTTPLTLAVISDIVSDTEMKAIQTDGAVVPGGNYVILLNDSLTVDGMAQDVAETLRYYQSKETVIEEALEFFKDFDLQGLKDLVARIEQAAKDADQAKLDAQAAQAGAENAQAATNQIKMETQQIKDSAIAEINLIKNDAFDARDEAELARDNAQAAKAGADTAKAGAETARDEAQRWAQQVNPENLLHKDQNLADVIDKALARSNLDVPAKGETFLISNNFSEIADRAAAWLNVRPIGSTPLSGDPVNDYDATTKRWVVNYVGGGGGTGPTMNGVQNYGVGQLTLWHSRAFIPEYAVTADGQLLNRADWPELWAHAQMHTPVSDTEWIGNSYLRGRFSTGNGTTTFRVPDLNGVQSGSVNGLFGRGDAGISGDYGVVNESALPNISGAVPSFSGASYAQVFGAGFWGAFTADNSQFPDAKGDAIPTGTAAIYNRYNTLNFDASRSSPIYGRYNTVEAIPNAFKGVWIIRASGGFTAANTSWSVINSDSDTPPSGTTVEGGKVASSYKTGTTDYAEASMAVRTTIGGQTAAKINIKRGSAETNYYLLADGAEHTIKDAAFRSVDTRNEIQMSGGAGLMQQSARDFRNMVSYALLGNYPLGVSSAIMRGDQGWGQTSSALIGVLSSRNWNDNSGGDSVFQIGINRNGAGYKVAQPSGNTYYLSDVIKFRDERNTTVDSNGFIKAASPIVKLFGDGTCETNDQAEGAFSERISEGVYRVSGVLGFNSNASWGGYDGGFEIPKNSNGLPMLWVDYSIEPNGDILIKTYHRTHENAPSFANNVIDGYSDMSPIDIPYGRWVDLRVQMPQQEGEEAHPQINE